MQVKWLTGSLYLYFTGYAWERDKEGKGGGSLSFFAISSEVPADVDTPPPPRTVFRFLSLLYGSL